MSSYGTTCFCHMLTFLRTVFFWVLPFHGDPGVQRRAMQTRVRVCRRRCAAAPDWMDGPVEGRGGLES